MRPLGESTRINVVAAVQAGKSVSQITEQHGCSRQYVSSVRKSMKDVPQTPRSGRPKKVSATTTHKITRLIRTGECKTAVDVAKALRDAELAEVTPQTVRGVLKERGMVALKKKRKSGMEPHHKKARLAWALKHKEWTVEDWKRVIWSDETKINRIGSDGIQHRWVQRGETGLEAHNVTSTLKFGGGNVMVWGCMDWDGAGYAQFIQGRMDADQYVSILRDNLLEIIDGGTIDAAERIFQQDNDPKHTSKKAKAWFERNQVRVMSWPAQSPDLNPIEHLWSLVKRKLAAYDTEATSMHALEDRVKEVWTQLDREECRRLIASMPRRCQAVVEAQGGPTKY